MLCLSGFEIYSRWVPLICDLRGHDISAHTAWNTVGRDIKSNRRPETPTKTHWGLLLTLDKHIVILKYLVCFIEILCLKIIRWYCLLISAVISIEQKRCWYIFRKPTFTQMNDSLERSWKLFNNQRGLILPFEKRAVAALIDDYNEIPSFLTIQKPL